MTQDAANPNDAAPTLVDIGANLAHDSFDHDLDAVLARARNAGVAQIVVTGSCADSNDKAQRLAQRHPGTLYATAGLHPHHASDWHPGLADRIREAAAEGRIVSQGECGLDYFRNFSPHTDQRKAFVAQLEIATETALPVFLHQRDAHPDFLAILREFRGALGAVVVHCFTDTQAAMEDYLDLDCHIGITGWICDERRGRHLLDAVRVIPDHRLLAETDAPYLLPRTAPKSGDRRNEPAMLPWVIRALAGARDQTEAQVAAITATNARAFFSLPSAA